MTPDKRDPNPVIRRAQRILLRVHELHKLGYQRLRIVPGMAPSGMYWRCSVTHVGNILARHGAMWKEHDRETAHYSTGDGNVYFGWEDARRDTARQLAVKFIERFRDIANKGLGADWPYAGWYVQMLGFADRGVFPLSYSDSYGEPNPRYLETTEGFDSGLPMPPGGEAVDHNQA